MDIAESIEPITRLKTHCAELIGRAVESRQPIIITQKGKAKAVLQDVESYQRQRDRLLLLRLAVQGDEAYRRGEWLSHEQVKKHFEEKFARLKENG